jgi:phage-related holin
MSFIPAILQALYDFYNWPYFWPVVMLWIIIDFAWISNLLKLIERIGQLLTKPLIFYTDEHPNQPKLYPRLLLEQFAQLGRSKKKSDSSDSREDGLSRYTESMRQYVFNPERPLTAVGNIIAFALFVFFLLADSITIANTLVLMGLISANLPDILQRLDLAILGGAVLTAVVGVWMLVEMSGDRSGDSVNANLNAAQKRIFKAFSMTVTLFSFVVMLALAIQRMISLGYMPSTPTSDIVLSFVLYGVLAINNSLSAALTFQPALSGLVTVIYILFIIIPVIALIVDIVLRVVYFALDVLQWLVFTPFLAIPHAIRLIFKWGGG